MHKFDKIYGNC